MSPTSITSFDFKPGARIGKRYVVQSRLGVGWEGEVYKLRELDTNIERAGKFFFPHRNRRRKASRVYAQKLHKLRAFPILIQYHASDIFEFKGQDVVFLVSEFVEGELLEDFLSRQRGKRIGVFQGLHLLHALAAGMEGIHEAREYHGDLHTRNIIVRRFGISFDLKLLDMYHYGPATSADLQDDVVDLVRIFYDAIGGAERYAKQPIEAKQICRGLKRTLILEQYRTAGQLRHYLETMQWS
ncbi:Protein kinase domain protein [Posidoniimonas polymericola]|uniref:Protein kinase domain protein n=1 Tax=Posidoniimonas polymericola TaxID=2528002 RepID=A0A5C5YHD6_9BACT|nr:protein kinase [Posidoniimonas polymericola]TWT74553.1 Protein kinase domain protein [Posidoniimonas polymericola]